MTTSEAIERLQDLQSDILTSSEYVFGSKDTDAHYVGALRVAIDLLEKKEIEELTQ